MQEENQVLGSGQWATKRAIKGSLPSPAIKELLLQRNYLGNETNLKLTACSKPSVHYMRSHTHTHRRFGLRVLAALFYMHSSLHTQLGALCTHTDTCVLMKTQSVSQGCIKSFPDTSFYSSYYFTGLFFFAFIEHVLGFCFFF